MKINVDKKDFITALSNLSNVIKENSIRPVLSGAKLVAQGGEIKFTGATLEVSIKELIPGEIINEGKVVFKVPLVLEYVKLIDDDKIIIEVKENKLFIHKAEFSIFDAEEYPNIKDIDSETQFSTKCADFIEGFEKVGIAASTQTENVGLNCIRVESYDEKLHFAASDTYRLAYYNKETENKNDFAISIPLETVNIINKIFKSYEDEFILSISGSQLKIDSNSISLTTRLIDNSFPDYKGILGNLNGNKIIEFNTEEFIKGLKKVLTVAKINQETKDAALFDFIANKLHLIAASGRAKTNQKVDTIKEGEDFKASLNVKFILDFISKLKNNTIISATNSSSMFVFKEYKNDDYVYIVMPLALREV